MIRTILPLAFIVSSSSALAQQKFDPPAAKGPDKATLTTIADKTEQLRKKVAELRDRAIDDLIVPSVEVYLKAAEWIVRHNEFYTADSGKWTLSILDIGLNRADEAAKGGKVSWLDSAQRAARGYRSKVDGSVQPYAVSYPLDYGVAKDKTYRLDIVLHGRDATICEVKFLNQHPSTKAIPKDQDWIQIDIYGRGNNAYRWAGESDIWEALDHFRAVERKYGRAHLLDPKRVVIRGFSMGGAGTWHLGLHHPDRFAVMGPGAGFTTTHGYIKDLPNPLPSPQEECLRIYDAVRYTENARMIPIVAYSGEIDPQKAAADNIEKGLRELKIDKMTHIVAPGLAHSFPAEWQKKANVEWSKYAGEGKGRAANPSEVHFVTYTLKYPKCEWIELTGLERHYDKATIDAKYQDAKLEITTKNVRSFHIIIHDRRNQPINSLAIDGQPVRFTIATSNPNDAGHFEKKDGRWAEVAAPKPGDTQKRPGLQGPIDDAFTSAFVCVMPTGESWNVSSDKAAKAQLERFSRDWNKYMRGSLPTVTDKALQQNDITTKNLILFGDPSSNRVIGEILEKLPLKWAKDEIVINDERFDGATHMPALIFPNPLNPRKYVVINTGHTFHEPEFKGTNAQLYPRLGDFAILKPTPTQKDPAGYEVVRSGLFNESWHHNKK